MTVIASLFSGISGIVANGSALSVAADNIANMSTPGFKASIPVFESALSQRIGAAEVGLGSRLASTTANFSQGGFANSTRPTDLAIQDQGFFIVKDDSGNSFYTRAGLFEKNSSGRLVTSAGGFILQGNAIDDTGTVAGTLSSINFTTVNSAPVQTDQISYSLNLASNATIPATAFTGTSFAAAESTSNFSTSQTVYDSEGNARAVTTYFNRTAANTWEYHTLTLGSNLSNYTPTIANTGSDTVVLAQGQLLFNTDGTLTLDSSHVIPDTTGNETAHVLTAAGQQVSSGSTAAASGDGIRWVGATAINAIDHDFGQIAGSSAVLTQYAATQSTTKVINQNGRSVGDLQTIEIREDGTVRGNFTNGTSRDLYKIPLATFLNEEGLTRVGSNLYTASSDSGDAQIGLAATAGKGKIRSSAVEQSNVDLATEFVRIITFQRAFQASTRTVTTAAELLQDLVQLGR